MAILYKPPSMRSSAYAFKAPGAIRIKAPPKPKFQPIGVKAPPQTVSTVPRDAGAPGYINPGGIKPTVPTPGYTPNTGYTAGYTTGGQTVPGPVGAATATIPNLNDVYTRALNEDPIYAQALLANEASQKTYAGRFLEGLQGAFLKSGLTDMAKATIGKLLPDIAKKEGLDPSAFQGTLDQFYQAVEANPFSGSKQLTRSSLEAMQKTGESVNKGALFYGGWGAKAMADQTYANQMARANFLQGVQEQVSGLQQSYADQINQAEQQKAAAAEAAYGRALSFMEQYGFPQQSGADFGPAWGWGPDGPDQSQPEPPGGGDGSSDQPVERPQPAPKKPAPKPVYPTGKVIPVGVKPAPKKKVSPRAHM